jgi:hypothetical protein
MTYIENFEKKLEISKPAQLNNKKKRRNTVFAPLILKCRQKNYSVDDFPFVQNL